MHIPDGWIPYPQAILYWAIALIFIYLSLRWVRREMDETKVPLVAILAAGYLVIQWFNVPVGMGTSGHFVGAALAAIVLGSPYAAVFILSLVLIFQGVIFVDGGITTMGANILNMGVIGGFVGFYSYHGLLAATKSMNLSAFVAGWLACLIPAIAVAVELWIAGMFPLGLGLATMGLYHVLIGIIEGGITVVALRLIASVRPDIVSPAKGVTS